MTTAAPDNCAICNRPTADGVKMRNNGMHDGLLITCPQCGTYDLIGADVMGASFNWEPEFRSALSCASRQASEIGERLRITEENVEELAQAHTHPRVSETAEQLLREIAKRAVRPQKGALFFPDKDFTLIDCHSKEEFLWYSKWLDELGLAFPTGGGLESVQLTLSMKGWNQVQPLPRPGGIPGQCFVAMWFSEITQAVYEQGIEPAVIDAGFKKPIRIDRKEHNNEIPDEIMKEIRNAQFVVADFTGQRPGVYYEAGFAMGLGRPVIWCCRHDEIKNLHFDTSHKNHIPWHTPQDLRERLYTRIRATILQQG
jgi:hypothetical protein